MANLRLGPTSSAKSEAPGRCRRSAGDAFFELESDLSAELPITVKELDAIVRLLGDDLKSLLAEG